MECPPQCLLLYFWILVTFQTKFWRTTTLPKSNNKYWTICIPMHTHIYMNTLQMVSKIANIFGNKHSLYKHYVRFLYWYMCGSKQDTRHSWRQYDFGLPLNALLNVSECLSNSYIRIFVCQCTWDRIVKYVALYNIQVIVHITWIPKIEFTIILQVRNIIGGI